MVSRAAQEEMRRLRNRVAGLGHKVRHMLPVVTEILVTANVAGARLFLADGGGPAQEAASIDESCEAFLALHSPVAAELRHVVSVVRMAPEFSRSADLMANVCKATVRLGDRTLPDDLTDLVRRMSHQTERVLESAIEAHETQVLALADAVADMDDHLDELHRQFVRRVIEARRAGEIGIDAAVQLAMVARFYERVGDHAVNVASIVRFEIEGEMSLVAAAEDELSGQMPRGETPRSDVRF